MFAIYAKLVYVEVELLFKFLALGSASTGSNNTIKTSHFRQFLNQ